MTVYSLFGQAAISPTLSNDSVQYTMGMQFTLSEAATLTGIWFYSASGAGALPTACAIYQMTGAGTGTQVSGSVNSSPSWSGAAGSGWVKCSYAGGPVLAASTTYKVVIQKSANAHVYSFTSAYWTTGAGASGLTVAIITAPNSAGGDGGQDTFHSGTSLAYPATSGSGANYWIDVEVTNTSANVTGVAAEVTVQGGVGTPSSSAAITGAAAQVTVQGGTGAALASALFPADSDFIPGMAWPGWATPGDATTGTPASVTGTAAQVTVQGGIGAAGVGANVPGVAAQVTVQGGIGSPSGGVNVSGVAAPVNVAGGIGAPSAGVSITGTAGQIPVAGGDGAAAGGGNVTGLAALVNVAGGTGSLSASANLAGTAALVTVAGGIGVAAGTGTGVTVTGVAAQVTVAGGTGTPKGAGTVLFTYGTPYFEWAYGTPCFEWEYGTPYTS